MILQQHARTLGRQTRTLGRSAFTLMEVLVVVAILVVLASGSLIYLSYLDSAKLSTAKLDIKKLETAVDAYYTDPSHGGQYPPNLEMLTKRDQQTGAKAPLEQK